MKKFMYCCIAILALALAYHFGATSAQGQTGSMVSGISVAGTVNGGMIVVMTPNGDCYQVTYSAASNITSVPYYMGNFWGSAPVQTNPQTLGQIKAKYR